VKYIDGFRDPAAAAAIRARLDVLAGRLTAGTPAEEDGRRVRIMEVCGSHTMAIARYGIRDILPPNVDLISGPGCPVCVTPTSYIDAAIALADRGVMVVSFGDMIHVPGSTTTLAGCRARGGSVEICYTPLRAIELAEAHPGRDVVFLAIGFETTIAPVVSIVVQAVRRGLRNVSLLTAFKLVPPALRALLADPEIRIDAFLCPAHVSAIIGADAYRPFAEQYRVPCVVAGFEPLDILYGLQGILEQVERGEARVANQYVRVVTAEGNVRAQELMAEYLEPVDAAWRGIGVLPASGLGLKARYAEYDAGRRHGLDMAPGRENPACACGEVLKGKLRPPECRLFGKACSPEHPVGPCMVSAEGTCSAYYKYLRV
jgi:hydrogenase expression/formation protein HypD